MAGATEALRGRHGVLLYSVQTAQGTAVTPATAAGIGGYEVVIRNNPAPIHTIGQTAPVAIKPGLSVVEWTINLDNVQTVTLLNKAARTSGVLPFLTLGFGVDPDTGTSHAYQVQDCKVGRIELSIDAEGDLKATLSGIGGAITDLTSLSAANLAGTPLKGYDVVLLRGGAAFEATSFSLSVDNDIKAHYALRGAAASSFKRGWSYLTEGKTAISGSIGRFTKSGIDLQAAATADDTLTATITDIGATGASVTCALTGVQWESETRNAPVDGDISHTMPFQATALTIS